MDNMSIIVRYCRTFTERKLREYDLTFGEQVIIMFLSAHDNVNQDTISKAYLIDKGMVAKTLNKLEQKGFIMRKQNPENKRENIVSLTQKGIDILNYMSTILEEWNEVLYKGMSEEEIADVKRLTGKMEENVAKYLDER
jgi:DNA-binding MarR family transcriptional regulator